MDKLVKKVLIVLTHQNNNIEKVKARGYCPDNYKDLIKIEKLDYNHYFLGKKLQQFKIDSEGGSNDYNSRVSQ